MRRPLLSGAPLSSPMRRVVVRSASVAVLMFAFGYAMVPLYELFCDITGLNGKVEQSAQKLPPVPDYDRPLQVQFLTSNNARMPWQFKALDNQIETHVGVTAVAQFSAHNTTGGVMTAQAVPSVSPAEASLYLEKVECFCFDQQTLQPGASIDMPVVFYFRNDLPDHIETVTLAYTLFDVSGSAKEALSQSDQSLTHN